MKICRFSPMVCAGMLGLFAAGMAPVFAETGDVAVQPEQRAPAGLPVILEAWSYGFHGSPVFADLGIELDSLDSMIEARQIESAGGGALYLVVTFDQPMAPGVQAVSANPAIPGITATGDGSNDIVVYFPVMAPMDETCYLVDLAGSMSTAGGIVAEKTDFCVCYNEADVDRDGVVTLHDRTVVLGDSGKRADQASTILSDIDRSGTVTTLDANIVLSSSNYGHSPAPCPALDCNNNGIPDDDEIAGGIAADCNHNRVPDECDLDGESKDYFPDFPSGDGIPDECCLGTPAPDLNGDGDVDLRDYSLLILSTGQVAGSINFDANFECVGCERGCADFNEDGVVDDGDLALFVDAITGPL